MKDSKEEMWVKKNIRVESIMTAQVGEMGEKENIRIIISLGKDMVICVQDVVVSNIFWVLFYYG